MAKNRYLLRSICAMLLLSTVSCLGQVVAYFPEQVLGDDLGEEKSKVVWYSKFLTALHEPSLWEASSVLSH